MGRIGYSKGSLRGPAFRVHGVVQCVARLLACPLGIPRLIWDIDVGTRCTTVAVEKH